jgi:hypothetical protein
MLRTVPQSHPHLAHQLLHLLRLQGLDIISTDEVQRGFSALLPRIASGELLLALAAAAAGATAVAA